MAVLNSRQHQCNVNAGRILHPRPLLGGQGTVVWDARWLWSLCQSVCAQRYALRRARHNRRQYLLEKYWPPPWKQSPPNLPSCLSNLISRNTLSFWFLRLLECA